jgi:hypothetical protein
VAEIEQFVIRENISRYRRLLAEATDSPKREELAKLLAEEERKLRQLQARSGSDE